ncbi:ATP-binding protein [Candidatus Nitrospira bockiana]
MRPTEERQLLEREALASVATSISSIFTVHEPLDRMLHLCMESLVWHLDVSLARVWLLDHTGDTLILAGSAGLSTNLKGEYSRVPVAAPLKIGEMVRDRRPRLTNRLQEESWVRNPQWVAREHLRAFAGYPLVAQDKVVGVLALFARHELGPRTLDELAGIAANLAQCIVRSRTEEALRTSEERLALAVEGAGMALWDWDLQSDAMVWSPPFFALLGYEVGRTLPSREAWEARIHPEDRARVRAEMAHCLQRHQPLSHDYRLVRADTGDVVWVAARGKYLYDAAGVGIRLIGALFNINHRKQAEAEIQRLLEEAQARQRELREKQAQLVQSAKLASIGELTTGLAHELNNPLNNIALFLGNALDLIEAHLTGPLKDPLISSLREASGQVDRAAAIITHLRMFGRSGKESFQPLEINSVIRAARALLAERMRLAQVETIVSLEVANPLVDGCQIQLEQVLVNLLANAIDAVAEAPRKAITLSSTLTDDRVTVSVKDSGIGIPPEYLSRVFDPFFTTKEVGQGTGLGLSIAFGIVKEHHGEIAVTSQVGHGTEFTIQLPISGAAVLAQRPLEDASTNRVERLTEEADGGWSGDRVAKEHGS